MGSQTANPSYAVPPPFSPPLKPSVAYIEFAKSRSADVDMLKPEHERSNRAASVISGMSIEDMEAAETLNSLQQKFHSPPHQSSSLTHVKTETSYDSNQQEPLLSLVTSQYPFAGSFINGSLVVYKTTQSYIPGAEWTERNIGLPIAGTVARISGAEAGLRWALQKRDSQNQTPTRTPDVEKGYAEAMARRNRTSDEILPPYNPGDRSPPYTEAQTGQTRQPPPGWGQQLIVTTSGLGIAMSEESLKRLRYCLSCLRWANGRLDLAIQKLKSLLQNWNSGAAPQERPDPMSVTTMTQSTADSQKQALSARIAELKADVLATLKQVVSIVSNYAGGALPENARNLVHRHLVSLPQRFSIASARTNNEETADTTAGSAKRVIVLAQEGLDMMEQVSSVVNDTLVSAESWCEKLGKQTGREIEGSQSETGKPTTGETRVDVQDVKMQM